jgi:hypothetical protein
MSVRNRFQKRLLGWTAGLFLGTKKPPIVLKNHFFKTSAQRIGIRFTDQIRDVFRKKWLKIR